MGIKILSLNINGFRGKQLSLDELLHSLGKVQVTCLQEHRIVAQVACPLSLFGFHSCVAHENKEITGSRGLAVLVSKEFRAKLILSHDFVVVCEIVITSSFG